MKNSYIVAGLVAIGLLALIIANVEGLSFGSPIGLNLTIDNSTDNETNSSLPDVNITLPENDTNVTLPDDNLTDSNITIPDDNVTTPDSNATIPDNETENETGTGSHNDNEEQPADPWTLPREQKIILVDKHGDKKIVSRESVSQQAVKEQKRVTWSAQDRKVISSTLNRHERIENN